MPSVGRRAGRRPRGVRVRCATPDHSGVIVGRQTADKIKRALNALHDSCKNNVQDTVAKSPAKLNGKMATEAFFFRDELRIYIFALSRRAGVGVLACGVASMGLILASGVPTAAVTPCSACRPASRYR